ncbi:MAG: hypothetical protein QXE15_02740, partial [Candidatus Bathyarchaeia archaeon]
LSGVDSSSFLWGIGLGKEMEKSKMKRRKVEIPLIKLEEFKFDGFKGRLTLRNIGQLVENIKNIEFFKVLKKPKPREVKTIFGKKIVWNAVENIVESVHPTKKFILLPDSFIKLEIFFTESIETGQNYSFIIEREPLDYGFGDLNKLGIVYLLKAEENGNIKELATMDLGQWEEYKRLISKGIWSNEDKTIVKSTVKYCINCGVPMLSQAKYCPQCATEQLEV